MSALPDELVEHETFMAEVDALRSLRTIATLIASIDEDPNDEQWQQAMPAAMSIMRSSLDKLEQIRPRT